eukprot:1462716-Rhodomonas_salina.1
MRNFLPQCGDLKLGVVCPKQTCDTNVNKMASWPVPNRMPRIFLMFVQSLQAAEPVHAECREHMTCQASPSSTRSTQPQCTSSPIRALLAEDQSVPPSDPQQRSSSSQRPRPSPDAAFPNAELVRA